MILRPLYCFTCLVGGVSIGLSANPAVAQQMSFPNAAAYRTAPNPTPTPTPTPLPTPTPAPTPTPVSMPHEEFEQLKNVAQAGDPQAQVELAMAYHNGVNGAKPDDAETIKWLTKAAEQGDLEGQYNLAIAYYHGFGVKKDLDQAVNWFEKAAEQGYDQAQYIFAAAYQNGSGGLPKDLVRADMWLGLAEAQGNKEAALERISMESQMSDAEIAQAKLLIAQRGAKTGIEPQMSIPPAKAKPH